MVETCRNQLGSCILWFDSPYETSAPYTYSKILYSFKNALRTLLYVDESDFSCGRSVMNTVPLSTNFRGYNLDHRYLFRPRSKLWMVRNEAEVDLY